MYQAPIVEISYDENTLINPSNFFVCDICSSPLSYPYFKCNCQRPKYNTPVKVETLYDLPVVCIEENNCPSKLQTAIDRAISFEPIQDNTTQKSNQQNDLFVTDYPDFVFDVQLQNPNNNLSSINNVDNNTSTNNLIELVTRNTSISRPVSPSSSLNENSVIHYITTADSSLAVIALRYGVKVSDIRKANRLYGNNLYEYETLIIPGVAKELQKYPDPDLLESIRKSKMIRKFKCKNACEEQEAKYYLEVANYDYEKAMKEYKNDIDWEKLHPYSPHCMSQAIIIVNQLMYYYIKLR